ncbi:threonine/serine dehydratase [Blastomonas sp.]|uniref:threonine ammonia-lyase n=1 Tax=Blastomonas sp. TaxID=1909299 RepID=UPI0035938153
MTEPSDPLSPTRKPSREGIERAAKKIAAILPPTPLMPLKHGDSTIWCKAECLQPMGAFKIRGAWHRLSDMSEDERARGVVAFSSGNHAQGVAWAAKRLNMRATIVMPADAPQRKIDATRGYGADIITFDRRSDDRVAIAQAFAKETGAIVVPSFDDPWIIEGQGSTGLEALVQIIAQAGISPDKVVTCCGGGGLAAGIALALPGAKITVVEPDGWDDMGVSLRGKKIVPVGADAPATVCDALQTPLVSPLTFNILKDCRAQAVSVSDDEVFAAMRHAHERLRLVLEPGGAVALAAILAGKVEIDDRTLVILSGGNVDPALFSRALAA